MREIGQLRHALTLQSPGVEVPDGRGGWTATPVPIADVLGEVVPATAGRMEQAIGSAMQASASHVVTIRYLAGVTVKSTIVFHDSGRDRRFTVSGVSDPDERHQYLVLACEEVV
jgi:SPP1 family predicted phage head-tail adaptor